MLTCVATSNRLAQALAVVIVTVGLIVVTVAMAAAAAVEVVVDAAVATEGAFFALQKASDLFRGYYPTLSGSIPRNYFGFN